MDKILHDPKDPKLWESCRILSISRSTGNYKSSWASHVKLRFQGMSCSADRSIILWDLEAPGKRGF